MEGQNLLPGLPPELLGGGAFASTGSIIIKVGQFRSKTEDLATLIITYSTCLVKTAMSGK